MIENQPSSSNVLIIKIGEILEKTIYNCTKTYEVQISSIEFFFKHREPKKEFRVGDIINFTEFKDKDFSNLYLIKGL